LVYLVAGDGEYRKNLENLVKKNNLEKSVIFTGRVEDSELPALYSLSDVFIMIPRELEDGDVEGFGIVLLEAQYFGKPVIGTNSGGIPETFRDKETGFLVAEGDTAAMTDRIMYLKDNPEAYARMSRAAGEFMREEFSWTTAIERHLEVYRMGHRMD